MEFTVGNRKVNFKALNITILWLLSMLKTGVFQLGFALEFLTPVASVVLFKILKL